MKDTTNVIGNSIKQREEISLAILLSYSPSIEDCAPQANSKMASSILSVLLTPTLFLLLVTPHTADAFLFSLPPCRKSSALRPRLSRQACGVRDNSLARSGIVASANPGTSRLHSHAWKRLATQAGEQAINWIIPAIAIRILFGGFRALWGNKKDDEDDETTTRSGLFGRARKRKAVSREDEKNEAIARIIGEGKELDNAFYNAEILEDIALGTNLGPWSPNGFVSRHYTDLLSNKERRPISRLFSWFLGSPSDGDLYSSDSSLLFSRDGLRRNPALPRQEFLRVERINERLDSYGFSVQAAVRSRAVAATALKQKNFERAFGLAVGASVGGSEPLNEEQLSALTTTELFFLKRSANTVGQIHACDRELRDLMMKRTFQNMEIEEENGEGGGGDSGDEESDNKQDAESSEANTMTVQGANGEEFEIIIETDQSKPSRAKGLFGRSKSEESGDRDEAKAEALMTVLGQFNQDLVQYELDFIASVVEVLGPARAPSMRAALLHTSGPAGRLFTALKGHPLKIILGELGMIDTSETSKRKCLFLLDFPGDISASQVRMLREEITAVIRSASEGDEVLVVLKTGGGSVTGYGLASGLLQRIKDAGLKLTIAVEEYAASGGYMMCCVADRIVASPFAALGSIGVVSSTPNFFERLQREGVEVNTITAGKYKRTLTATKKTTKEDLEKAREDAEAILDLFKGYVKANRPALDLEDLATGEVWFGTDAVEKGLCDEIITKDDLILRDYIDKGFDCYSISYEEPKEEKGGLRDLLPVGAQSLAKKGSSGFLRRLVREVVQAAKEETGGSDLFHRTQSVDKASPIDYRLQ